MQHKFYQLGQVLVSFLLVVITSGVLIFATFTLIDLQKRSSVTLKGVVASAVGKPISNASITIQGKQVQTDQTGSYSISDLKWGWNTLEAEAETFLPFAKDIYLPFGVTTVQSITLDSVDYAILKGKIIGSDAELFEKNKSKLSLKLNATMLEMNDNQTFETGKVPIQKVSIIAILQGFDDYFRLFDLKPGVNDIGTILLNKSTSFGLQLKNSENGVSLFNSSLLLNGQKLQTDSDGYLDLTQAGFIEGETIIVNVNGYKEQSFIYEKDLGRVEILLTPQADANYY